MQTLNIIGAGRVGQTLARRWTDPTFPANFPWFGSSDYWQGQVQMLEEQLEAMEEPPLIV